MVHFNKMWKRQEIKKNKENSKVFGPIVLKLLGFSPQRSVDKWIIDEHEHFSGDLYLSPQMGS